MLLILKYTGAITLWIIILSVGEYLLKTKIIEFRLDWFKYIYYFGLGVLAYNSMQSILKDK